MTTTPPSKTLRQLQDEAAALYKSKKWKEALAIYERIAREFPTSMNPWDGFRHAGCLRRIGRLEEAETLCRKFLAANANSPQVRNELGWTLYSRWLKPQQEGEKINLGQQIRTVQEICTLTPQDKFSPFAKAVLKLADVLKDTPNGAPADRIAWLKRLSVAGLTLDTFVMTDAEGVQREHASDKEHYYAQLTDALFSLDRWQECIDACTQAMKDVTSFHYENDIWIARRAALSRARLGATDQAINELKALVRKQKKFFLLFEIADLLLQTGRVDEALPYAAQSALGNDAPEMKVKVYDCLGRIYEKLNDQKLASEHFLLQAAIYAQNGWRIDETLAARVTQSPTPPLEVNIDELGHKLVAEWSSVVDASRERFTGAVKRVGETNGHLRSDDGKDYFFSFREFRAPRRMLIVGARVTFSIEEGFDKKKNVAVLNAVDVQPTDQ